MEDTIYFILKGKALFIADAHKVKGIKSGYISEPTAEEYEKAGAYPREESSFIQPKVEEGYRAIADGYELINNKWVKKWKVEVKDA